MPMGLWPRMQTYNLSKLSCNTVILPMLLSVGGFLGSYPKLHFLNNWVGFTETERSCSLAYPQITLAGLWSSGAVSYQARFVLCAAGSQGHFLFASPSGEKRGSSRASSPEWVSSKETEPQWISILIIWEEQLYGCYLSWVPRSLISMLHIFEFCLRQCCFRQILLL